MSIGTLKRPVELGTRAPMWKPVRQTAAERKAARPKLAEQLVKFNKRQEREKEKAAAEARARKVRAAFVALIWARDKGLCRVCGRAVTKEGSGDPRLFGHVHEIVYRSAGGKQVPENALLVCGFDHQREHDHKIAISGTASKLSIEVLL